MPADTPAPDRPVDTSIQALLDQAGIHRESGNGHVHPTAFYDELTLTLCKAESLTAHLIQQLENASDHYEQKFDDAVNLYALTLIAKYLNDHLTRLRVQATAWQQFDAQTWQIPAGKKGGR